MGKETKRVGLKRTRRRRAAGQSPLEKYSIEQVAKALWDCGGIVNQTCKKLRCEYGTVLEYLKKYPELQEVREQAGEARIDTAEAVLDKHVRANSLDATKFLLKTQGKKRGYSERTEVTGADGADFSLTIVPAKRPEEKDVTPKKKEIEE